MFHDKVACIEEIIQETLFFTERQLYMVTFVYDHIAEFHVSWVSSYLSFSCRTEYIYDRCDVDVQLQQVYKFVCDL